MADRYLDDGMSYVDDAAVAIIIQYAYIDRTPYITPRSLLLPHATHVSTIKITISPVQLASASVLTSAASFSPPSLSQSLSHQ